MLVTAARYIIIYDSFKAMKFENDICTLFAICVCALMCIIAATYRVETVNGDAITILAFWLLTDQFLD